jgi:hypothetical protein
MFINFSTYIHTEFNSLQIIKMKWNEKKTNKKLEKLILCKVKEIYVQRPNTVFKRE